MALESPADLLAKAMDRSQCPSEPNANLGRCVALQAQLQDRAIVVADGPEQVFDRLGQGHRRFRPGLPVECEVPGWVLPRGGRRFAAHVAPAGPEVIHLVDALTEGDESQQPPEAIPVAESECPL